MLKEYDLRIRVRLILFRSFRADEAYALHKTDYYELPDQSEMLNLTVRSIRAEGGCKNNKYKEDKVPKDGLEAVACALETDSEDSLQKKQRIVIVMTDNCSQPMGFNSSSRFYPDGMPESLVELEKRWKEAAGEVHGFRCSMILMTPDVYPWNTMRLKWERVSFHEYSIGEGLKELKYPDIIGEIKKAYKKM